MPATTVALNKPTWDRGKLLADARLPALVPLPVPGDAVALPDDWARDESPLLIQLAQSSGSSWAVRRVAGSDGGLYLEIFSEQGAVKGPFTVTRQGKDLGNGRGPLWLSLKPRIGKIGIHLSAPGAKEPVQLTAPTTLINIRGRKIFLNGEPFLIKGAMSRGLNETDAAYIHSLGINTLRGLGALAEAERFGFMSLTSLNFGDTAPTKLFQAPDAEFQLNLTNCLAWLRQYSADAIASPYTLILQLGNERTGSGDKPPGSQPLTLARRHVSQLLAEARNLVKPMAPMLPIGYANQDLGFLTPDCMDVYMHNSYLDKDRYEYPWKEFLRWQGCLPPDGPTGQGRPFVNSEFGANRYLCQAYLEGPNNPFLERIHAWNFPCRWAEFMEQGTAGGAIYCLYDVDTPRDQGCSRFGILTNDRKPKLACWEVAHMWRDFEMEFKGSGLVLTNKRDYWARDCVLNVAPVKGAAFTKQLNDFPPHSTHELDLSSLSLPGATNGFHWTINFTTHGGLVGRAVGAWPEKIEESGFLERLKTRDTYPFLSELFDTEVLSANAKPAPRTLFELTTKDGLIPVALRKRNGVTYLLVITRENPNQGSALRDAVTIDVAFQGRVERVDDMTGKPLEEEVHAETIPGGLRLKNIQAARIPGAIGQRSKKPFKLPVYRISP